MKERLQPPRPKRSGSTTKHNTSIKVRKRSASQLGNRPSQVVSMQEPVNLTLMAPSVTAQSAQQTSQATKKGATKKLLIRNKELSERVKTLISDRRQNKIKLQDLEQETKDLNDRLFLAERKSNLTATLGNRKI